MINTLDKKLLNNYAYERGLQTRSIYGYKNSLKKYIKSTGRSFTESLKIYDNEEENRLRWKNTTLKQELVKFRQELFSNYLYSTAKIHFQHICAMIKHYDISIHDLPKINRRNVNINKPLSFNDLLTHIELKNIINHSKPVTKALIFFMISSGCARKEALGLSIEDYINANGKNIQEDDLINLINSIDVEQVPQFSCKRFKTNKYYFTFITPQANHEIKKYLLTRKNLEPNKPLFKTNNDYLNTEFDKLNKELDLGYVNGYRRCRTHMFRKYHASTLYNKGMSMDSIDILQGRGKSKTHQSYFMENPVSLKKDYLKHMECLII